jgi:hypothetical protein
MDRQRLGRDLEKMHAMYPWRRTGDGSFPDGFLANEIRERGQEWSLGIGVTGSDWLVLARTRRPLSGEKRS